MAASPEAWRPDVQSVANLVPTRTGAADAAGVVPRGTFDADTEPTADQVAGLIRGVQSEVMTLVGAMPDVLAAIPSGGTIGESPAGHVVALGAASLVEAQFYPDMQGSGADAPAAVLERRYKTALAALATAAKEINAGQDPGDPPRPVGTFPDTVAWGRGTSEWERW